MCWYLSNTSLLSRQPEETLKEDFLFPMSNRLSYASSPESDGEIKTHSLYDDNDASPTLVRRPNASPTPVRRPMVRSSSDPSIATVDNIPGIPPYQAPPSYLGEARHVSVAMSFTKFKYNFDVMKAFLYNYAFPAL